MVVANTISEVATIKLYNINESTYETELEDGG